MSETEKLRALLAEARGELHSIEALTVHPGMHHGKDAARLLSVLQRIDAALAEPITLTQSEPDRMLADAKQQGMRECPHHRIDASIIDRAIREAEGKAFARGTEAMREAAASIFDAPSSAPGREVLLAWADSIRALPVPEDKE